MTERKRDEREEVLNELGVAVVPREFASEHVEIADARESIESIQEPKRRREYTKDVSVSLDTTLDRSFSRGTEAMRGFIASLGGRSE